MSQIDDFESAVTDAALKLNAAHLRLVADRLSAGWPADLSARAVAAPAFAPMVGVIVAAAQSTAVPGPQAGAYLRGLAAGLASAQDSVRVETVWSGPGTHHVPVRATAQVLVELIDEAADELLMMTYSARPHQPVVEALTRATGRGVAVGVVVETLAGAGGALSGAEPAAAFAAAPRVRLWHWPTGKRTEPGAKMHAKIAVADRAALLISSANLTQSGVSRNIEAGLLVRGGVAPVRVAEHITGLQAAGILAPLLREG